MPDAPPTYCVACGQVYSVKARGQMQNAKCPINGTHVWIAQKEPK